MARDRDPLGPAARDRLGGSVLHDLMGNDEDEAPRETSPEAPAPRQPPAEEKERAERPKRARRASRADRAQLARAAGKVRDPRPGRAPAAAAGPAPAAEPAGKRVAFSVRVPAELLERARDAAFWERAILNDLFIEGLALRLDKLEQEHGGPFKPREDELRPGRKFR